MASPRDPNRIRRVRHLRCDAPGWVSVVICRKCGHMAALPYDRILKRFGELFPAEQAMLWVRCTACGAQCPEDRQMRLCEPGCPRQRG
jgi:ribosomal protein S26